MEGSVILVSVIGVDPKMFDLLLLSHFIEWYRKLWPFEFRLVLNSTRLTDIKAGAKYLRQLGISHYESWCGEFSDVEKSQRIKDLSQSWTVVVDGDEFVKISRQEFKNVLTLHFPAEGILVDRLGIGFPKVKLSESIWKQFPKKATITKDIANGCINKVWLYNRNEGYLESGNHFYNQKTIFYPKCFDIHHFKWTKTVNARLTSRLRWDVFWKEEYSKTLAWINSR